MKFIEYVSCCVTSPQPCDTEKTPSSPDTARRKRRPSTRGTSEDWQPSLFAITEDNAVAAVPVKKKPVDDVRRPVAKPVRPQVSKRTVNRCSASSVQVNGSSRPYDYYSREPIPMVIPAFSAAPFMF